MPLVQTVDKQQTFHTVHDGRFFSEEILSQHTRTPESNQFLIEKYGMDDAIQPSFIRPHRVTQPSFDQLSSDSTSLSNAINWTEKRAIMFVPKNVSEDAKNLKEEQVTPPMEKGVCKNRIPIAEWSSEPTVNNKSFLQFRRVRRSIL